MRTPRRADGARNPSRGRNEGVRPRQRPAALAALLLLPVLTLAACRVPRRIQVRSGPDAERAAAGPVRAAFAPAVASLRAAIDDGEEDLAFAILTGLRARGAGDRELQAVLDGCERVLVGRRLVRGLDLALRVEAVSLGERDGVAVRRFRLLFDGTNRTADDLRLRLPPGTLQRLRLTIDANGSQAKDYSTRSLDLVSDLLLPADETVTLPVLVYDVPFDGVVAVRDQWGLRLRSGEISRGEEVFPAARVAVRSVQREALAPFFPTEPVEPAELLEYVQREEIALPPLIERAVRIDPARHLEALELLDPLARRLEVEDPERFLALAPAMRWLAGRVEPGAAWTSALRAARAEAEDRRPSNLDLGDAAPSRHPAPRRGALELP